MKTTLFSIVFLLLIAARSGASPSQGAPPRIVIWSESPALRLQNVHIDPNDGKVRGTAYLNLGYAARGLPHVHVYGLMDGKIVYEVCDRLSRDLLAPYQRLHKGRDSFSVRLPANLNRITTIKVAACSRHDNCKMDDNRLFKLLSL